MGAWGRQPGRQAEIRLPCCRAVNHMIGLVTPDELWVCLTQPADAEARCTPERCTERHPALLTCNAAASPCLVMDALGAVGHRCLQEDVMRMCGITQLIDAAL